jgi:GT2 family glycosyltransferase
MAVDVVVINYKTPDYLAAFCESYEHHKFEGCTITVVDVEAGRGQGVFLDGSLKDGTDNHLFLVDNVGYARACNKGAALGKNDVILLANADTLLTADFEDCYKALVSKIPWGILGPRQVDEFNRITAGGIFGSDTSIGQRGWNELDHGQYADVRDDAKSVSGSLYFIKRKVWEELTNCRYMQEAYPGIEGAFIPTPHYYEETACSYHARAHGYKIVFYGPAKMIHYWHKASAHGGWADRQVETSKMMMRSFCSFHGIVCE